MYRRIGEDYPCTPPRPRKLMISATDRYIATVQYHGSSYVDNRNKERSGKCIEIYFHLTFQLIAMFCYEDILDYDPLILG